MALLKIIKLDNNVWKHNADVGGDFILTKFYAKNEFNKFLIVESYGAKRREYLINEIEVYNIGGAAETFTTFDLLFIRLKELGYTGYYEDGTFIFVPSDYISSDVSNALVLGADGKYFVPVASVSTTLEELTDTEIVTPVDGQALVYNAGTGKWENSSVSGSTARKQVLVWQQGNWSTPTLLRNYYIGYNGNAIEALPGSTDATTVVESMQGRNAGIGVAPFNCKIKRIIFKEQGSGSYTGKLYLASGLPIYDNQWNFLYASIVEHVNQDITATAYHSKYFEFAITDDITVPKGYILSPMLRFSAQVGATKTSVYIAIEIEEVI